MRTLASGRVAAIDAILDAPRGLTTDTERALLAAALDLRAELRRRTGHAGRSCERHPSHPASRCTRCRAEATPPPPGWRTRT